MRIPQYAQKYTCGAEETAVLLSRSGSLAENVPGDGRGVRAVLLAGIGQRRS
jgi:hypothetical protein